VGIVCALVRSGSVRRERQQAGGCEWAGFALIGGPFLDFRDPWGNRIEIVAYDNIQFTKAPMPAERSGAKLASPSRRGSGGVLCAFPNAPILHRVKVPRRAAMLIFGCV
jgi:hypothetical protein